MERGSPDLPHDVAASALTWWTDAGVDILVDEAPRDWLRAKPAEVAPADRAPAGAQPAQLPDQLNLFQAYLKDSDALPFASPAAPRVCPSGDPAAGIMIVTDMPTFEDCGAGALISGEAGRLFDRMLAAIGRDRDSVYLASISCFRSPDGKITGRSAEQCMTMTRHHIGLAAPKVVLLFGDAASKALLGLAVAQARGRWHGLATHAGEMRTLVTWPPSFLLRQPGAKAQAWADLQLLMQGLAE